LLKNPGYIPTLDGWRALAIVLVLLGHYAPPLGFFPRVLGGVGGIGVTVFFGISGLLIGTLLLRERELTGRIDFKGFYLRRCFRILPVAWVFLLVVAVARQLTPLPTNDRDLWSAGLFLRNYVGADTGTAQHFWSLAVEEHFYMILPLLMACFGVRSLRGVCLGVAAGTLVWRLANTAHPIWTGPADLFRTDYRIDALFDGVLAAIALRQPWSRRFLEALRPAPLYGVALAGIGISRLVSSVNVSRSLVAASIPLLLLGGVLFPATPLARVLELRWMRFGGRISYSLYIWQGLYTNNGLGLLGPERMWVLNVAALLGTALMSYFLLERPLIRVGHRLSRPASRGRPELD